VLRQRHQVGWLKAYRGGAATIKDKTGKPKEIISHKTTRGTKKGGKRYKIIEGTHPFNVEGSRYLTDKDD
jgi:hypothetical protein